MSLISFFRGAYSLYIFSVVYHGGLVSEKGAGLINLNKGAEIGGEYVVEHLNLFMHYYPLLFIFLNLSVFIY